MNHRILLVREWDSQMSGSTCCGRLDTGIACELGRDGDDYSHTRAEMERMGEVYRALRAELPRDAVDLTVVDPRNMVWLLPAVWRDARRRGFTRWRALRELQRATAQPAIVVDGNAIISGRAPDTEQIVDAVFAELATASSERHQRQTTPG